MVILLLEKVSPTDGIIIEEAHQTSNPWMRNALTSWGFRELFEETYWFDLRERFIDPPSQVKLPARTSPLLKRSILDLR